MFFTATLVLFFSQTAGVASVRCITAPTLFGFSATSCTLTLTTDDSIPNDLDILASNPSTCVMEEAGTILTLGSDSGSCYAEVAINYQTKAMLVKLSSANNLNSFKDPYDDMMGSAKGIRSVIQYKISGNLEKNEVEMTTRVQCETADNCALEKLRALLSNLIEPKVRLPIFKQVIDLLNTPDASHGPELTCQTENSGDDDKCSKFTEARCTFEKAKDSYQKQECIEYSAPLTYDIEQRHNVIEELTAGGENKTHAAFKLMYLCKKSDCNDDTHSEQVTLLLHSFAQPSAYTGPSAHTDPSSKNVPNLKPPVNPAPQPSKNGKSTASLHYPSIGLVLFLLTVF